jgi:5-methylthioadenosine/S-adenosylhomocysteine deaminase
LADKGLRLAVSLGEASDMTVYSIENALRAAKERKASILAHTAEQREDAETVLRNFQKGIVTLLQSFNALRPETILVHANHISESEAALVKEANGTVVVCPRSTAAKQTGYPALRHLAKRHVRLALGTDWGSVDMLQEMRFLSQLPLVVPGLRVFSPLEVVRMATINGAAALDIHKDTGSLEVGKRADIVFFSLTSLRLAQLGKHSRAEDVARCVVDVLTTGDISDVMIAGEFVLRDRTFAHFSEAEWIAEWRVLCSRYLPGQPAVQPSAQPSNIIPFTQEPRETQEEPAEGFESGFPAPASPPAAATPEPPPHPFANRPKVQREPVKIELPKNTRTVFGEDEEF